MGSGGKKHEFSEIPETRAAQKEEAFELILDKIEDRGGEITADESTPLVRDIGMQEMETGEEREVEFTLNKMDFKIIRRVETHRIQGEGRIKHLEELKSPRIDLSLKKRIGYTDDWQNIDLDALL